MKITDYELCSIEAAKGLLKDGWQPWGSPFETAPPGGGSFPVQAMVKYEEPAANPAYTDAPESAIRGWFLEGKFIPYQGPGEELVYHPML